jgi:micrococcal nuclease
MYEYKLKSIKSVYDGDTLVAVIDLGFGIFKEEKFRLSLIDAPEIKGEDNVSAKLSRDFLRKTIESGEEVIIKSRSKDKYGRYLAEFFVDGESINLLMISEGYAKVYGE